MLFLYQKTFIYQGMNCIFELSSFSFIINKGYSQTGVTFLLFTVLKSPHLVVRFQFLF